MDLKGINQKVNLVDSSGDLFKKTTFSVILLTVDKPLIPNNKVPIVDIGRRAVSV